MPAEPRKTIQPPRTPAQRAAEEAVRERFRNKPGLRELAESGEISQETYEAARRRRAGGPPDSPFRRLVATLRAERERLGLSLSEVAERAGIDRAAVHKLELGLNRNPTVATLERYANALGVQIAWTLESLPSGP
jgi:DNA-binding XRE family transcriptional regulator